ncbi:MAG: site-specific DNA-methyltransferase, partial [Spirochaetales bacterium]|nr:site-specific DNA-methyltransferase [Spirochaetales bacterium]
MSDFVLWYAKNKENAKSKTPFFRKEYVLGEGNARWIMFTDFTYRGVSTLERKGEQLLPNGALPYKPDNIISQGRSSERQPFSFKGLTYDSWQKNSHWKANYPNGMNRLGKANRIHVAENSIQYIRYHTDFELGVNGNMWSDTGSGNFTDDKVYVVQTNSKVIERCILMTTDPGDLVLDPTCGSGTTAYVAEQWGRRWITIDTSRVALALARARIMGARYPFYLLADSDAGRQKESEVSGRAYVPKKTHNDIRHGFVCERVPHITLKSIANNAEIDVLHEEHQPAVLVALEDLNAALKDHGTSFPVTTGGRAGKTIDFTADPGKRFTMPSGEKVSVSELVEWEVPRERPADWPKATIEPIERFWRARIARQRAIDGSIAAKAEFEYLYDKPYDDNKTVRVAGPFTVESLSPHRMLGVDEEDQLIDPLEVAEPENDYTPPTSFDQMILEELRRAGVQQAAKGDRITFTSLTGWPGSMICAEAHYNEGETTRRAGIFIGPEFGTVRRADLVDAAREAGDAGFDVVIACAFNYDAHATEFSKLGRVRVLKARMNADLHMAEDLKKTDKGNLFVIFGEPDIDIEDVGDGKIQV